MRMSSGDPAEVAVRQARDLAPIHSARQRLTLSCLRFQSPKRRVCLEGTHRRRRHRERDANENISQSATEDATAVKIRPMRSAALVSLQLILQILVL